MGSHRYDYGYLMKKEGKKKKKTVEEPDYWMSKKTKKGNFLEDMFG